MANLFGRLWNYLAGGSGEPEPEPSSSLDYAVIAAAKAKKQGLSLDASNALSTSEVLAFAGTPKGTEWTGQGIVNQFRRLVRLADQEARRALWEAELEALQAADSELARATVHVEPTSITIDWG